MLQLVFLEVNRKMPFGLASTALTNHKNPSMTNKHYYDKEATRDEAKEKFSVFKKKIINKFLYSISVLQDKNETSKNKKAPDSKAFRGFCLVEPERLASQIYPFPNCHTKSKPFQGFFFYSHHSFLKLILKRLAEIKKVSRGKRETFGLFSGEGEHILELF